MSFLSTTFTFDDRGLKHVAKALRNGSPILTRGLRDSGYIIMEFYANRFDSQPWAPLKPTTALKKAFYGYGGLGILKASMQLYNAINPEIKGFNVPGRKFIVTRKSVTVGYGPRGSYAHHNPYAHGNGLSIEDLATYHQLGTGDMPAREIIVDVDRATTKRVADRMQEAYNKLGEEANNK